MLASHSHRGPIGTPTSIGDLMTTSSTDLILQRIQPACWQGLVAYRYTPRLNITSIWPFTYEAPCLLRWFVWVGILHVRAEALEPGYFMDSNEDTYSRLGSRECIRAHARARTRAHTHAHTPAHTCACTHARTPARARAHSRAPAAPARPHARKHSRTRTRAHACTRKRSRTHTRARTHAHAECVTT
jgi:hypothetical protein